MDYTYFIDSEGKLIRTRIEQDYNPEDPRYDRDGNIGHMMCWYPHYNLGDYEENHYDNPHDFLFWQLGEEKYENATIPQMLNALERKGYYFIPLAVYEHSGITMWCGSRWSHFDAQWDCSDVGWIYTTKEEVLKSGYRIKGKRGYLKTTAKNWRKVAQEMLKEEVKTYDQYLTGQVYGFISEVWDGEDWIDEESCWGFYSDKWGDELAEEIIRDFYVSPKFINEEEAEEKQREDAIMMQIETMVCI